MYDNDVKNDDNSKFSVNHHPSLIEISVKNFKQIGILTMLNNYSDNWQWKVSKINLTFFFTHLTVNDIKWKNLSKKFLSLVLITLCLFSDMSWTEKRRSWIWCSLMLDIDKNQSNIHNCITPLNLKTPKLKSILPLC